MPQVEVTFDIDANGILSVKATEKTTGKVQSIRIEASSGLSDAEVEKMRKDAEANAEIDQKKRDLVEAQNTSDQVVYSAEKALKEHGDKVGEDIKKNVQEKIDATKAARAGTDAAAIKSATEALYTAMSTIGEAMSKNQTPPAQEAPKTEPEGPTDTK